MPESAVSSNTIAAAIAGCGAISAVGCGIEAHRKALSENLSGLAASARFDSPRFQSNVVGAVLNPSITDEDDPAFWLADESIRQALQHARSRLSAISPERIGLVLSTTKANIQALERLADGRPSGDAARRHLRPDLLTVDLAKKHGARGPIQCVSVACISGLVAVQQGARLIQRGDADAVIVVGVDHLSSFVVAGFSALKALDPAGCRPFDAERRGLSPGEAAAAIVLIRHETNSGPAVTVRGWGTSNDSNHMTGPSRDGLGLARAIRAALTSAEVEPSEVEYVNAHGTGTIYNDAMEAQALRSIFGENAPPLSGFKGMLGHTLGAAGVIEAVLCVLAMEENCLPGTPRLNAGAEGMPASLLGKPRKIDQLNCVLKLNSGFGGLNGALVLSRG